jgi:hypothetical protein
MRRGLSEGCPKPYDNKTVPLMDMSLGWSERHQPCSKAIVTLRQIHPCFKRNLLNYIACKLTKYERTKYCPLTALQNQNHMLQTIHPFTNLTK